MEMGKSMGMGMRMGMVRACSDFACTRSTSGISILNLSLEFFDFRLQLGPCRFQILVLLQI